MVWIRVIDAEKARKYVNIGVHLTTDIPEHPSTLEEAVSSYAKILELVGDGPAGKDIDRQILGTEDELKLWGLKRGKFRLEIKEKYRAAVIDTARETWHEQEASIQNFSMKNH